MLRYGVPESRLPHSVLDAEIAVIRRLGAEFRTNVVVGSDVSAADVAREFDAVVVSTGEIGEARAAELGVAADRGRVRVRPGTHETDREGFFAGGAAVRPTRMAVRAVADGRALALCVDRYLAGGEAWVGRRPFDCRVGRLSGEDLLELMKGVDPRGRGEPSQGPAAGLSAEEARGEARRCMHCDCRKAEVCALRRYAGEYEVGRPAWAAVDTDVEITVQRGAGVVYEAAKCIKCGRCIRLAEAAREPLGLTFVGRGFDVRLAASFDESVVSGLGSVAAACIEACPTGALARNGEDGP